jgi:hypothetical protein
MKTFRIVMMIANGVCAIMNAVVGNNGIALLNLGCFIFLALVILFTKVPANLLMTIWIIIGFIIGFGVGYELGQYDIF